MLCIFRKSHTLYMYAIINQLYVMTHFRDPWWKMFPAVTVLSSLLFPCVNEQASEQARNASATELGFLVFLPPEITFICLFSETPRVNAVAFNFKDSDSSALKMYLHFLAWI